MLFAVSIIFIALFVVLFFLIYSAKLYAKKHTPYILEQRDEYVGVVKFEHYFLANEGIFVIGVRHRPSMLLYSSAYSFFGTIALVFAALNFYYNNYVVACIMLLISANVFFSKTGSWFPHVDNGICIKRTIMNWMQAYPEDFQDTNPLTAVTPLSMAMYYDAAISISEIYFFGETQE